MKGDLNARVWKYVILELIRILREEHQNQKGPQMFELHLLQEKSIKQLCQCILRELYNKTSTRNNINEAQKLYKTNM